MDYDIDYEKGSHFDKNHHDTCIYGHDRYHDQNPAVATTLFT
jgi:hypothetical protein